MHKRLKRVETRQKSQLLMAPWFEFIETELK